MRRKGDDKLETNPTVINRIARDRLGCSFCPPHRKENAHGRKPKPDRGKNPRRRK
jgi:hypothetical protein